MSSKRNYLSIAELEEYANITVTDETEAYDQISQAEEIIDAYVGFQQKSIETEYHGRAIAGSTTSLTLQADHQNIFENDYFKYCMVEIIGGTGVGERKMCLGSTKEGVLTTEPFTATLNNTSVYRIFQLGKFPRLCDDTFYETSGNINTWYKFIPEKVKRAVASQVEYKISMGDSYFTSQKPFLKSEDIDDYSYTKSDNAGSLNSLISPKAKILLRGIRNITGQIDL